MPVVEERLSLLEVKMEEVGTTLVRIEGVLGSLFQMVQGLDQRVDKFDQRSIGSTSVSIRSTSASTSSTGGSTSSTAFDELDQRSTDSTNG